ncbi:MAG: polymer-forming cytoskeletal protein [Desulfovibrionaceae bacterium]|nr:polymer-forming cytoskeletal protein [Desulfovibrionaceae bacterium]
MARDEINAFLGSGTVYTGDLSFEGAVRIDGTFSGNITSEGTLIVGQGANVKGSLRVGALVASGSIEGEVVVSGKAVLHKSATLQGKLATKLLVMEEGAMLDGDLCMKNLDKREDAMITNHDWAPQKESLQ